MTEELTALPFLPSPTPTTSLKVVHLTEEEQSRKTTREKAASSRERERRGKNPHWISETLPKCFSISPCRAQGDKEAQCQAEHKLAGKGWETMQRSRFKARKPNILAQIHDPELTLKHSSLLNTPPNSVLFEMNKATEPWHHIRPSVTGESFLPKRDAR